MGYLDIVGVCALDEVELRSEASNSSVSASNVPCVNNEHCPSSGQQPANEEMDVCPVEVFDPDECDEMRLRHEDASQGLARDDATHVLESVWLADEQKRLSDEIVRFSRMQQQVFEQHLQEQFLAQRLDLTRTLSSVRGDVSEGPSPVARSAWMGDEGGSIISRALFEGSGQSRDWRPGRSSQNLECYRSAFTSTNDRSAVVSALRESCERLGQRFHISRPSRSAAAGVSLRRSKWKSITDNLLPLRRLESIVEGGRFKTCVALVICLNAIFIGVASELSMQLAIDGYELQQGDPSGVSDLPAWIDAGDVLFNVFFTLELLLRILCLDYRFFTKDWKWNLFDFFCVLLALTEVWLRALDYSFTVLRMLRIMKIFRTLRFFRLLRFATSIPKLNAMTAAIASSGVMFLWAVLVLSVTVFLFSLAFVNGSAQYLLDAAYADPNVEDVRRFFGSLPMTMLSLLMVILGGVDWYDVLVVLYSVGAMYSALLVVYIVFASLSLLNLITAVFVNEALESARKDPHFRRQVEVENTAFMLEALTDIFRELDTDGDDTISETAFVQQVEHQDLKLQFALLGFYFSDGLTFFKHLDVDCIGRISVDSFVMGCLRLKGGALLIDANVLMGELWTQVQAMAVESRETMTAVAREVQNVRMKLDALPSSKPTSQAVSSFSFS